MDRNRQVNILFTVPEQFSELRVYGPRWQYANESEMRVSMTRVRDEVFLPYAVPVLLDGQQLVEIVRRRSEQVNAEWRKQINDHNDSIYRTKASEAFREKRFTDFIVQMSLIPDERKTALEIKKVAFARKQLRK
ncbi:hypothetical protein [Stieleria varia]|nr:hypothetical protein [Stieleria varia]